MAGGSPGKKTRKHGRMGRKLSHQRYVASSRYTTNKIRRIIRFMKANPNWEPDLKAMDDIIANRISIWVKNNRKKVVNEA